MAVLSELKAQGGLQWTKGLLVPERLRLCATAGRAGARAARVLYQQRRHPTLASATSRGTLLALTLGIGSRCGPPVDAFDELCDLLSVAPVGAAAIRSWRNDRLVICIIGRPAPVVVKVGSHLDAGLAAEAMMLDKLNGTAGPMIVPRVRWHGGWRDHLVLAMEALELVDRRLDASMEEATATATALSAGSAAVGPLVHGDLAPWNLLRTRGGLALVDWERGRTASEPLFDLAHFVITRAARLDSHQPEWAVSQLTHPGSPGWRHLGALGVDPSTAPELLRDYLERSWDHNENTWDYRKAVLRVLGITSTGGGNFPAGPSKTGPPPEPMSAAQR